MEKLQKYKTYNLQTTNPISELGNEQEVELWMELRGPDFRNLLNGDEIFGNLPEELQKKYIGLGNELSAGMVRKLNQSAMSYYISKKKEKLLTKSLKDLNENDMEVVMSKEMRPYLRQLRMKYEGEIESNVDPSLVKIEYPNDVNGKFARMFGLDRLFEIFPENMTFLQIENKSKDDVTLTLPETIGNFVDLEVLVCENIIDNLPESIGNCEQLTFLNLTNNKKLSKIPKSVIKLTCLDYFSVEGSNVDPNKLPKELLQYITPTEDGIYEMNFPPEMRTHCRNVQ